MKTAAIPAAFAVGWLTGSHAGYKAGAESEHVRIDARATLPVPAPPVEIVERVRSLYFPLWAFFRSSYVNFRRQEA